MYNYTKTRITTTFIVIFITLWEISVTMQLAVLHQQYGWQLDAL